MSLEVNISGHGQLGGTVFSYTVYKVDVFPNNSSSWCVYRRYKAFAKLHGTLLSTFGTEAVNNTGAVFPEKNILSGSKEVVTRRMVDLQEYLNKVLTLDLISSQPCIIEFLDFNGKGSSGATKDLGAKQITLEAMALCKPCISLVETWASCFVVLTKSGTVFILRSVYDSVADPIVAFPIVDNDVLVTASPGSIAVNMLCRRNGSKLKLKFSTTMQHATWLRALGDCTTKPAPEKPLSLSSPRSSKNAGTAAGGGGSSAPHGQQSMPKSDDLSSMYGI